MRQDRAKADHVLPRNFGVAGSTFVAQRTRRLPDGFQQTFDGESPRTVTIPPGSAARHQRVDFGCGFEDVGDALVRRSCSQIDGLGEDPSVSILQPSGRDHVDREAEQFLQLRRQPDEVEERALSVEVDQQIDVAARAFLAAGDRPEETDASAVVARHGRSNRISLRLDHGPKRRRRTVAVGHCHRPRLPAGRRTFALFATRAVCALGRGAHPYERQHGRSRSLTIEAAIDVDGNRR